MMKVLLFARARDLAGRGTLDVELEAGATVADLRRRLAETCPPLAGLAARSALAVNGEYADETMKLPADAEIALLPPVSGG